MMQTIELIGQVTADFLKRSIQTDEVEGVARFLLNRLTARQVAAICQTILQDSELASLIEIQIPRSLVENLVEEYDLPAEILTDERTVHLRHSDCQRPALLLANVSDDQAQSLNEIASIGAHELKGQIECWIDLATKDLEIPAEQVKYWQKALKGLQKVETPSLENFAEYIVQTRSQILKESLPVIDALGWALPALRLPRDSGYFRAIPESQWGQTNRWEGLFRQAFNKRACLLLKQTPSGKPIDEQELQTAFDKVKVQISADIYPTIQSFIESSAGWTSEAEALAQFEWESSYIRTLFSGLKTQRKDIGSLTLKFFEDEYPEVLTESEIQHINTLKKRKKREALDEDREFYEAHRQELESDRKLKVEWDKFIYGQPLECTDFLIGLLQVFERLFDQAEAIGGVKLLKISTHKGASKSKWLELNADVGRYFCTRYRGIEQLTGSYVEWKTHWLFKYDTLLEDTEKKQKPKYRENTSTSRTATEIKFYVEVCNGDETLAKTQLIWRCNPNAVGMELPRDLKRLEVLPFQISHVSRELVSKKGRLQGISLSDVGTLMAAYRQDRGSLVSKYNRKSDFDKTLPRNLKKAVADGRLSQEASDKIANAWKVFSEHYKAAISGFVSVEGQGIANPELLYQCEAYEALLESVLNHVRGDQNRIDFYQPILNLGCIRVERGKPAAIIAPWHPLRLASMAVKARQLVGLFRYILSTAEVNFGDSRLFFADLCTELEHPYYPEVCVGYQGQQPELLAVSDTLNDYSLMERPTQDESDRTTSENPTEAANRLLSIVRRYVELLPHEKTNLSIVLYQTDSIKLPQAIVRKLSEELQSNHEEVRCQLILRHRNRQKLAQLYEQMLENSDADSDAFIASEASQDFMARLRVAVMSDDVPTTNSREGKFADIVFLQDAVSRQAKVIWKPSPLSKNCELLNHSPARWSRKRPAAKDEFKSTVYLTCPQQPTVGQTYLNMIHSIISGDDYSSDKHSLPARQISFKDEIIKTTFDESHRLGEWVVNYDDLLERRQLVKQGVKVIRYQQRRTDERNFLVSSDASLNILKVLIRRRLDSLNLALESERIEKLVERLIEEANIVSGDIVLRAAKCGRFASELMGVVLSKFLIAEELGVQNPIGWYFLDDYASWLGQKEGQIADIMAISPQYIDGEPILKILVTETKYVDVDGLADARKKSQNQLRQTIERIADALFNNPGRLDRDLWLARFGDLLLDGIEFSADDKLDIEQWRDYTRSGRIRLDLSGYSHVFVSGSNDSNLAGERISIPKAKVDRCFQEVFDRELVRQIILTYEAGSSLMPIREQIGDDKPWTVTQALKPAERVSWGLEIEETGKSGIEESSSQDDNQLGNLNYSPQETTHYQISETEIDDSSTVSVNEDADSWASPALTAWWQQQKEQSSQSDAAAKKWLEEVSSKLRTALMSYNLQAKIIGSHLTPNAAIVRFKGSDNLRLDDIEKRRSPLLTTHSLNVISVYGQPGEVIVSVARPQRQTISLREVWAKRKVKRLSSGVNLSFVIGVREIDGELLYLNLGSSFENLEQHAPHTLIAGATGSGKSVLLQNLLLDICATNSPKLTHIYLIDPKAGVDYSNIEELPHLPEGIVTERDRAAEILESLIEEMDSRYHKFKQQKVKDLQTYNSKVSETERLPVVWLVHDEFAEWMLIDSYKDVVSSAVQRLGVKARAAGIHLIFAAQRPDATVLPVQLRDNLGNRLILRVESVGTSEIALGQKGAESLLGKGHLAARLTNQSNLIYAQVPFLTDEEMIEVAAIIKQQ